MISLSKTVTFVSNSLYQERGLRVEAGCQITLDEGLFELDHLEDARNLCILATEKMRLVIDIGVRVSPRYLGQIRWEVNSAISNAIGLCQVDLGESLVLNLSVAGKICTDTDLLMRLVRESSRDAFAKALVDAVSFG